MAMCSSLFGFLFTCFLLGSLVLLVIGLFCLFVCFLGSFILLGSVHAFCVFGSSAFVLRPVFGASVLESVGSSASFSTWPRLEAEVNEDQRIHKLDEVLDECW